MCRTRCVLALVALYVRLAQSWEIAVAKGDLIEFYTNDTKTGTVHFNSQHITALAYDEVHNRMLYVDKQPDGDAICAYDISSKDKCFTNRSSRYIRDLAFDPATELLFFSDTNERSINSISLKDGSINNVNGNLLIKMDEGTPTDIAVDSCRGFVYWINTNLTTRVIERARFNGSEREVVINTKSFPVNVTYNLEPCGLAIDQQTQKIYWVEPESRLNYTIYYADLNGKNKKDVAYISHSPRTYPSTNCLHVSKTYVFWRDWCRDCITNVWKLPKTAGEAAHITHFTWNIVAGGGALATNYRIEDQSQGIKDCEPLTSLKRSNSHVCVHGVKVNGQSLCKCTPGYIGEQCDISVCENYCLQGNCSVNDEGLPKCRCNAGYSGERCEVYACHDYCLNTGNCSLNENSEPVCQCGGNYVGDRCEVSDCMNYCHQGNCSFNEEGLPECRCNAGYSGERCEVYACHDYCLNTGNCSLNENSEPVCQCKGNYVGDRCEVSDCMNYCHQGNCSFNEEGLPECRCNAGYSGERCEVYACHGYCLNNGDCSLNQEDEPFCQCVGNHEGSRCETVPNVIFTNTPAYPAEKNPTLADLVLSIWRKRNAKIFVYVEN